MSLRALKKQQQQQILSNSKRNNLYKKSSHHHQQQQQQQQQQQRKQSAIHHNLQPLKANISSSSSSLSPLITDLRLQKQLLGRDCYSNPELRQIERNNRHRRPIHIHNLRTKSENDIKTLLQSDTTTKQALLGAKSEVCLQTISSHNYDQEEFGEQQRQHSSVNHRKYSTTSPSPVKMLSGARSHRDLTNSTYNARMISPTPIPSRRLSESSLNSAYSHSRTSAISSSSYGETVDSICNQSIFVGIRGYEVIEERARFTVYKLRVENPITNDCWLVLRRYTDFVRLNNKLKQAFPHIHLILPRKKIFGDNFNSVFLDNRVQGLQIFVNSIMARDELRKFKIVREFFCLDEPPSYSESMEECRAIFEAQEETIAHLKMQINSKNELILNLQQKLRDELLEKERLKETIKNLNTKACEKCGVAATSAHDDGNIQ